MKKPNITEGEWVSKKPDGLMANLVMVDDVIIVEGGTDEESQAISAVPEMIDVLIESYKAINSIDKKHLGFSSINTSTGDPAGYPLKDELLHNIEKALEKAGVTLTEE